MNYKMMFEFLNLPDGVLERDLQVWAHDLIIKAMGPWHQIQVVGYLPEKFDASISGH